MRPDSLVSFWRYTYLLTYLLITIELITREDSSTTFRALEIRTNITIFLPLCARRPNNLRRSIATASWLSGRYGTAQVPPLT